MIVAVALTKVFQRGRGKAVAAVDAVSFSVGEGEIFGILGPNGAGKTTLLRMLGTIITPTSGYCVVAGARSDEAPGLIRRRMGFLSGNTKLYGRLTIRETLRYFGRLAGLADDRIAARTAELAESLRFEDLLDRRCDALSTGQVQKVSIARAILHEPEVLILDEPTMGLDIMTSQTVLDFVLAMKAEGRSVILSTHYLTEAEILCDRIGFLHSGRILAQGTREQLQRDTATSNLRDAFLSFAQQGDGSP